MTNDPKASRSLDLELLAAYIDNRLSPEDRAGVEAQLAADPDSYALLVEVMKTQDAFADESMADKPAEVMPGHRGGRRWYVMAGGVLAVAATLVLVLRFQPGLLERIRGVERTNPQLAKLVAAVGEERYIEARLTGGFKYGPLRSATRGQGDLTSQNLGLLGAAGELQKTAQNNPSAENLHAWGVAQLLLGDIEPATSTLVRATQAAPGNADVLADLSAAYVVSASRGNSANAPLALERAEEALQQDAKNRSALYNRALAFEALGLKQAAVAAWRQYLDVEDAPPWRAEAERRIQALDLPLRSQRWDQVKPALLDGRLIQLLDGQRDLLPEIRETLIEHVGAWLNTRTSGSTSEQSVAERVANLVSTETGDRFPTDLVTHTADALTQDRRASALSIAYAHYASAQEVYAKNKFAEALSPMSVAADELAATGSPLAVTARLAQSACEYYSGKLATAEIRLRGLEKEAASRGYSEIVGRSKWLLGLIAFSNGDLGGAERLYRETIQTFEAMHDGALAARGHGLQAGFLTYVGEPEESWPHRVAAIQGYSDDLRNLYSQLATGASVTLANGQLLAALTLQRESLRAARLTKNTGFEVESLAQLATIEHRLGRHEASDGDLAKARTALAEVKDAALHSRYTVQIDVASVEALSQRNPADAITAGAQALELIGKCGDRLKSAGVHRWMASAHLARRDTASALKELEDGIAVLRVELASLPQGRSISRLDAAWDLFDLGLSVAAASGDENEVLWWSERGHGPSAANDDANPRGELGIIALQSRLEPARCVVVLNQLQDELIVQAITKSTAKVTVSRVPWDAVDAQIGGFVDAIRRGTDSKNGEELFHTLLGPVAADLKSCSALTLVPHGALATVPFAALREAGTGKYLIEKAAIVLSPSVEQALGVAAPATRTPSVLIIGPPTKAATSLPEAVHEVGQVASLYKQVSPTGTEPRSAEWFLKVAPNYDVIHVATHALPNNEFPSRSRIVISDDGQDLFSADIERTALTKTHLVVLAACQTGIGRIRRGEGAMSLARAFMAAGAGAVVSTLWDVDDAAVEPLIIRFHSQILRGGEPMNALRSVQIESIREGKPPSAWAALEVASRD